MFIWYQYSKYKCISNSTITIFPFKYVDYNIFLVFSTIIMIYTIISGSYCICMICLIVLFRHTKDNKYFSSLVWPDVYLMYMYIFVFQFTLHLQGILLRLESRVNLLQTVTSQDYNRAKKQKRREMEHQYQEHHLLKSQRFCLKHKPLHHLEGQTLIGEVPLHLQVVNMMT